MELRITHGLFLLHHLQGQLIMAEKAIWSIWWDMKAAT